MEEAMVRDFERRVQIARKDAGLKKADKIALFYQVDPAHSEVIRRNSREIAKYVGAKEIHEGIKDASRAKEYEMDEEKILLEIEPST